LRQLVGADHLLRIRAHRVLAVPSLGRVRVRRRLLFLLAAMARHAALAARFTRFFTRPLVRGALLVRRLAALARDLSLLVPVHRCKATIFFSHAILLAPGCSRTLGLQPMCHENRLTACNATTDEK